MDEDTEPIVMDPGSGLLKAGFASDDQPKCLMPMVVGKPKSPGILVGMDQKDCYVGQEAVSKKSKLIMEEPVQAGVI